MRCPAPNMLPVPYSFENKTLNICTHFTTKSFRAECWFSKSHKIEQWVTFQLARGSDFERPSDYGLRNSK